MHKIVFIYPNKMFLEFIRKFLRIYNYDVDITTDGISGFNQAVKVKAELLIVNRELPSIDLDGFFIKKKLHPFLKWSHSFLVGNFTPPEIDKFKKEKVEAFISSPINPYSLKERLNSYFKVVAHNDDKPKIPMMVDMHSKGRIVIIQIEGNFEEDKLEILNYKLRVFFHQKKITVPKILYIFPSIYPETITEENIDILFDILNYEEFKFSHKNIKILTANEKIIDLLSKNDLYKQFSRVPNYYEGVQSLNVDFDKNKTIPVEYLKTDASYIYDLYDDEGDVRIPALSKITEEMKQYLINSGLTNLTYYSDGDIEENGAAQPHSDTINQFDFITSETEEVSDANTELAVVNDRINVFFNRLKGSNILVITENPTDIEIIKNSLESYLNIEVADKKTDIEKLLNKKEYALALLDHHLVNPSALSILQKIRNNATRRKMSAIILAKNMNKMQLAEYKKSGTDYILLAPFNTTKLILKVFNSVTSDRRD